MFIFRIIILYYLSRGFYMIKHLWRWTENLHWNLFHVITLKTILTIDLALLISCMDSLGNFKSSFAKGSLMLQADDKLSEIIRRRRSLLSTSNLTKKANELSLWLEPLVFFMFSFCAVPCQLSNDLKTLQGLLNRV